MTGHDDDRKLRALAERVRTAGVPPPEGDCPEEATLLAYRSGALAGDDQAAVDRHLARCSACLLAVRALAPVTADERDRLVAAIRTAVAPQRQGLFARLGAAFDGWGGRAGLAGAIGALAAIVLYVALPGGPPGVAAPPYELEWVTVSSERGAPEHRADAPTVTVTRPDAVVHAQFRLAGPSPEPQSLYAVAILHAPGAAHLRPANVLALEFTRDRALDLRLQAGQALTDGPGRYVLWVAIGTPDSRPHPLALQEMPLDEATSALLGGADEGRWTLQRLELVYAGE